MPRICKICKKNNATVPDRNFAGIGRKIKSVCSECHAALLKGDLRHILEVELKREHNRKVAP